MKIRDLIYLLSGVLAATTAFLALRTDAPPGAEAIDRGAGIDWSRVSSRDLNIAAVFLTSRDHGVRRALDSLEHLAAGDDKLRSMGHVLAHALGRFAIANKRELDVLAQCREIFQAGCYHGVLEGYLSTLPEVQPAAVASLCDVVSRSHAARLPALECAHGLGHGLLTRFGYSLDRATQACDVLADSAAQRECLDGVFMENEVHGTGGVTVSVGDAAVEAHQHGMSHEATPRAYFRASDLAFPCDSVAEAYQPACWSYQPNAIMMLTNNDVGRTIQQCDAAPPASRGACYRGVGKQSMGWYGWRGDKVVELCSRGAPQMLGECVAGGVEAHIDVSWKADEALVFCAGVPEGVKTRCFAEIGARMGLVHADGAALARVCARAPREFESACLAGGRRGPKT